jgi:DNA repair exonuclease SbcCD nuclease subunit
MVDVESDGPVPVFILPGNHDPLNAASVYRSSTFIERKPPQVNVIENTDPIQVVDGVELVGALWVSKRPPVNPVYTSFRNKLRALKSFPEIFSALMVG